jgi:hypothetical protein
MSNLHPVFESIFRIHAPALFEIQYRGWIIADLQDNTQYHFSLKKEKQEYFTTSLERAKEWIDELECDMEEFRPGKVKKDWIIKINQKFFHCTSFLDSMQYAINFNSELIVGKNNPEYYLI